MNPAIALGCAFAAPLHKDQTIGDSMQWFFIYPTIPFIAAVFGVLFYEFFYKKARSMIKENEVVEQDDGGSDRSYEDPYEVKKFD